MKKRTFLVILLVLFWAAFSVSGGSSLMAAEKSLATMKPTVWRTQSIITLGHYNTQAFVHFAEEVAKKTDGKLKLEVYPSGGLGHPIPKTVSIVRDGLMNVGQLLGAFVAGEFPLADVVELPGLVPEDLELRRKVTRALAPYYQKVLPTKYNQYYLGAWQSDSRTLGTSGKKISTLADLKGIKIRASGPMEVGVCKSLGAAPVSIATPEVYSAMASGTVDACFGADSWFASAKFWEVVKHVYSMQFDGHEIIFTINKDDFDALPPDVQEIVRKAVGNALDWVWPQIFKEKEEGRKIMIDHGVTYADISPEDWKRLGIISEPIVEEWLKKAGPIGKEMVETTRKVVGQWTPKKK